MSAASIAAEVEGVGGSALGLSIFFLNFDIRRI